MQSDGHLMAISFFSARFWVESFWVESFWGLILLVESFWVLILLGSNPFGSNPFGSNPSGWITHTKGPQNY